MGAARRAMTIEFHNTGLYNLRGRLSYPTENTGVFAVTRNAADVGKFKAPTLRNVAVTAPYMHDGSVATLEDAIDHYAAGGRTIAAGEYAGSVERTRTRAVLFEVSRSPRPNAPTSRVPAVPDRRSAAQGSALSIPTQSRARSNIEM
jgi:hypothetical protein